MEKDIVECFPGKRQRGGGSESLAAAEGVSSHERKSADTEHRTHHSRVHKGGGGHRKSKRKSTDGDHKENIGNSSRRDNHSHSRHTSFHEAEPAASTAPERHAAGAKDRSGSSSSHSSNYTAAQTNQEKAKPEKSTKSNESSSSAEGGAKDRSRREGSIKKKRKSHREAGTEQEKRSSSPLSISSKKSTRGLDVSSRDVSETQSRSRRSSRGSSHHSCRCKSRISSRSPSGGLRGDNEAAPVATSLVATTLNSRPAKPSSLLQVCVGTKGLLLSTTQELLPLPPLPKAAAAAAAALQEQCSKKKGQQVKAARRMAASNDAEPPIRATSTSPGGDWSELVNMTKGVPCTLQATGTGPQANGVSAKPAFSCATVNCSDGTETAADITETSTTARSTAPALLSSGAQAEEVATEAGGSASAPQMTSTLTGQEGKEPGVTAAVVLPSTAQHAGSIKAPSKAHSAAEAECKTAERHASRDLEKAGRAGTERRQVRMRTEDNATAKTNSRHTDLVGPYNGEAATKICAAAGESAATPRKSDAPRRAKVGATGGTSHATENESPHHERDKAQAAGKCACTVPQETAVQNLLEKDAGAAAERTVGSVTESKSVIKGIGGEELLQTVSAKSKGATLERKALQEGPQGEGEKATIVSSIESDVAASLVEGIVLKGAAAGGSSNGSLTAKLSVKNTAISAPGLVAAGKATVRRMDPVYGKGKDRKNEESAGEQGTAKGTDRTDAAANDEYAGKREMPRVQPRRTEKDALVGAEMLEKAVPQHEEERRTPTVGVTQTHNTADYRGIGKQTTDTTAAATAHDADSIVSRGNLEKGQGAKHRSSGATFEADVLADFVGLSAVRPDAANDDKEAAEAARPEKNERFTAEKHVSGFSKKSLNAGKFGKEDKARTGELRGPEVEVKTEELKKQPLNLKAADDVETANNENSETEDFDGEEDEKEEEGEKGNANRESVERSQGGANTKPGSLDGVGEDDGKIQNETPEGGEFHKATEAPSTPHQLGVIEAVGAAHFLSSAERNAEADREAGRLDPTGATEQLKTIEERESERDYTEEDEEKMPAEAAACAEEEDAASAISSLAASPSRYYSPSVSSGSKSSSPDSQAETTPKEAESAAEEGEQKTEISEVRHQEFVSETADDATVLKTAAEYEKTHVTASLSKGEKSAEGSRQQSESGTGTVPEAAMPAGAPDAASSSGVLRAAKEENDKGTDDGKHRMEEVRIAGKKLFVVKAPRAQGSVVVAKADAPAEERQRVVASAKRGAAISFASSLSDQEARKANAPPDDAVMKVKDELQQALKLTVVKTSTLDTKTTLPEDERRRQRSVVAAGCVGGRVWDEGLRLWKMLLRCEEVAYDLVYLRVLGNFACPRAEFVSVSSGCLGQPERAGDETEMLQQQEQLMLQFNAVHSKLRAGMGRVGQSVSLMRRRYTRYQQTLLSVGRRMEEELLQVKQLLQLQDLQHILQQQCRHWSRKSIDSNSITRPGSAERATACKQGSNEGSSDLNQRSGAVGAVHDDDPHLMWTGKGLLQLMSSAPLCWYVHDIVGMVCRRRSGGPFPERWAEYREWHGELVLGDVYNAWKAITLQRRKASDTRVQTCASTEAAATSGRSAALSRTRAESVEVASICTEPRPRIAAESGAEARAADGQKQHEETQKGSDGLVECGHKEDGGGDNAKTVGESREMCGTPESSSPAVKHCKQTSEQQRRSQEKDAFVAQPQDQARLTGEGQNVSSRLTEEVGPGKEWNSHDSRGPESQVAEDAETGVGASVCSSSIDVSVRDYGEKREEQGVNSFKKRKRTEIFTPTRSSSTIKCSVFCVNEEMVQHLVLLPCKAFLAERFFVTFPEAKAFAFGTGSLKQRVSAMRLRKSWRSHSARVKQQEANLKQEQSQTDEGGRKLLRVEEQKEERKEGVKTENSAEPRAVASERLASASKQETNGGKADAVPGSISSSDTSRADDRGRIAEEPERQQHIKGLAGLEPRKTKENGETGGEEEARAKKQKTVTGKEATGEFSVATVVAAPLQGQGEGKMGSDGLAGEANLMKQTRKGVESGTKLTTQQKTGTNEASSTGVLGPCSGSDLEPEVVAVINLCMTERYYPLPELRAQGIECYWLKVDGSGELPTEKVLCVFFRLLAFITHKYAKLKQKQPETNGELESANGVDSFEKAQSPAGNDIHRRGGARVEPSNSAKPAAVEGSSAGKIVSEAAAGRVEAKETASQDQGLSKEYAPTDSPTGVVNQTKPDSRCRVPSDSARKFTVLIHCTNGVNRTGLFTSLLLMNLMGCDCNFALRTFSDARGLPVTKEMFKKWLRSEEAKGFSKAYKEALQPPVLRGGVLAYRQRQQQQRHQREEGKEKDQQAEAQEIQKGKGEEPLRGALNKGVQAEAERECEQHKLDIAADARYEKENKQGTKFVATGRKVGNTVAVLKSADKSQKKKLRKKNQASLATLKGEHQATCGKEKQTLQTKKQKQEHTNQEAAHLKQREHQQESSYQAPGGRQQTQQQHVLEQPNAHAEVISPIEKTKRKGHLNEEDLTIETPFALMTAFEAERDFERNLEARLSARLESLLAAREEERQRLLVAASKFVPENVTDKCQPSSDNALATAVEHEPNSGGGGDYTTLSGVTAIQGTNSVNTETQPNERQVPQEQDGLVPDSGNADAERPRVSTKEQESGAIIGTVQSKKDEIRPVQSLDEEDHHKATEGVDSTSLSADKRTAGSAADSLPPADADARAPLDGGAASIIAERSQTEKEKLNRKPAAEDAVEMTEGDATAKQGDGGRFLHAGKDIPQFEAFCAKEKAFQAEIEVVEELRLQAKLAVQSIPQLPPRLPLDGIVLVGPIQNSLLAPEELLLQLLVGCPSLKIESLDILVGRPVKKVPLELRTEEPTELLSQSVLPVKQEGQLAEEAKEAKVAPTLAPPLDAAADSARTATVEQTIPNNSTSRLESVQQPQELYEVIWPESILTYPRKLVPIETRKKRTSAGVQLADERARQCDSGNTGSTGREAFLTRRKREREEGSREPASPPKEMHHQPQSGSRQKEDIEFVKSAACSSGSAIKLAATAVDSKEEVKEGGRIPIEEDGPSGAQSSVNLSTRHQRASTVEAMPTLMCNGSGAAVPAGGDTGPQVLRTIQSSSGVPKPTLLHTLQNLPRIGTLEVIKEEAEEYLEEDDSPSCAGFSGVAQPAARLLEGESAASTSIGGDQPGSSNHTSLAIPEGISVEKRRRTEDATRILEEGAQDVVASTASAESYPGILTSMGATNLEQQKISPSAEHHENDSGNVLSAVETAAATASPGGGTGTGIEGSTFGGSEEKESSHLLNKENSGKEGWHPARVCPEQAASERAKIPGRCSAVSGRIKASEISLNDLRRKGDGLFSQRELALRLLEYRDEDDLRLCYVARIQCADEASFVYLLSHRFQRMRQQPIHVYPSFCYPLLFQRGKRMDREILTHATAMVLAANATPPVTAVVQALAAARKGEHHDFLWLLGCRLGAARRGKSSMWRNPGRGDVGEQPALLDGQDLTLRCLGSAARASTLDMLLPPLPSRPVSMGNSRSRNRGRSPFEGLHIEAVSAGPCFYGEVGSERGGALGRLTPIPPFAIKEPPGKQMERPSFSSKFALLGAAPKLNAKSFASPLAPFTQPRCRMPGGHDVQDPGCCWPVFVPFGVRGGGEEHRYSSQPRPPWYDRGNLLLEEAEAPPFPAFYFTDAARAATQGRRMRNPGAATRSCVPAATRVPHGLLSPPLPGSALAAAALKMRRDTVNRSNLAAHRRDAWLLTSRSRTLSAGSGAAGALPSLFHRSESTIPFCLGNEEIPGGLGVGAKNIFGGRLLGRAREMSVAEGGGGGGRGVMQNEGQTSAFPRVAAGMRQQRGFPIARVSRIRLPSPAPSLSAFLQSPLPARNDIQVGKTGPINRDNACYVGMGKDNPRNECLGETASGATMEMQQQGGGTPAVWMSGVFDSCSGMLDESDTLNRPAAGSGIYNSLEGGTGSGGGGDAADSMNGRVPANPLHVWGEVASQTDTRAGHSTHLFETQVPGGAGRRQGLNRGPRNAQAANMRAELHRGERRYMSQQIAVTQPRNLAAAQRAPPPPPPLPGDSEVSGRETRRDTQGSWGGSRNLMSAQHSSTCGENWPGDNAGLRGSEQQHHQQLQQCQRQQRATGAIASAAGDRKGRVSGWTSESNHGTGGGREPQIHEMWGPRYQSLGGGESETTGGTAGDAGTLACGRWQQQQGGQLSARVRMHQGGAWEGAFRKEEREAARNTWSQPQSREGAGRSSDRGGDTPGWPAPYSGKLIHGVSPQHQLQAQQQQGVRSNHALEGGGTFGGTVDWGNLGNTTVSNAAARAAAASMAGKQLSQPGNGSCAGGAAEVWPLEGSTWKLPIGSSARGLKCGGNSGTSGGGAEYPHGREDTSQHRPYPGEGTGGTRSSNIDSATTGRQLVSEAGGTNSGAAAGTTWRGNKKTVGICEQQKQQHGYFCTDQEQRVHCSTAGGSNTGGATAAVAGAGFAPEDTGGECGLLPAAEEAYNSGANARGAAHVSGSTQAYGGPAPPVAPPSGEASGRGKALMPGSAYPPSFSVGPPGQGQRAADGGTVHMRDGYTFPPSSGAVGAGRDPAGFGAEGGQLQSGTVADTGKRGGAAQDLALYGGGKGGTAPDRLPQHLYNAGIAEYSVIKHGGPGTDSWAQESGKANCTRRGPTPAGGRGGYGRSRTAGAEMSLPSAEGAPPGSDNSLPPYNEYSLAGRGSVAVPGKNLSSIAADPGGTSYAPRGSGVAGESYGSGSAQTASRGGAPPPGKAYDEGAITGLQTQVALRPAAAGVGELGRAPGMGTATDTQQQFAMRGGGTQERCQPAEQSNQGRRDTVPGVSKVVGASAGGAGAGGPDGRRLVQRNDRRFYSIPRSALPASEGSAMQRAPVAPPPVPPSPSGAPQWTIQRLFQATGAPRPLASGKGVEQQQFGSSLSWQSAARVARGGPGGRGIGPGTGSGCNEGGLKDDARFTQHQQQHNILIPKQKQADWGAGLSNISDGSALLWPAKVPTEGGMPAAAEGQHSSTQQQQQTALMIQFAQQLAIMQQQQQSLANSAARGTSVDSLNVAANPFAGLIGSLQQGNPGLANSNLSQQQLQQQLLMMCMLHQQQQQQQTGANAPAPGLSAIDLQQLMLYTQYYSMLLSGMSEQQATATVQAQQLLQRQQDEIVKQQLLHHSIQQQQQLQLSLAGLNAAPAASFSGLSDSCKGPPPT